MEKTERKPLSADAKKSIIKLVCSTVAIVAVLVVAYFVLKAFGLTDFTQEEVQNYIQKAGVIAPLIYIGISFLQVTFIPIPGAVTILAGSYVFGAWLAYFYSYIGMLVGSMFAYLLGKWIGRPFVNWISGGKEKTEEWLKKLHGKENILLFFMFLFPFFPDDVLCAIAGILPISWLGFLLMQVVTRATSIGATLFLMSGEVIPFHGWGLIVLGVVAVLGIFAFVLCFKNAEKINKFFSELTHKYSKKNKHKKAEDKTEEAK